MAKEYIEREAAKESIISVFALGIRKRKSIHDIMTDSLDRIDEIHNADVTQVAHGEWIGTADGYADGELVYDMWACSECGYDADGADEKPTWNFCPNCGAKMDLEVDDGK